MARIVAALVVCGALSAPAIRAHDIEGVVMDPSGAPLSGATVWLNQFREPRAIETDAQGRFSFADVDTGPVQLVAYHAGFALGGLEGQCVDDIDVTLVCPEAAETSLRIINTRYEAVSGARIKSLAMNGAFTAIVEDLEPLGFRSPRSDEDGRLTIPYLPKDSFVSITIAHVDYVDSSLPALPSGIDLDFPVTEGVEASGRVMAPDGAGVASARVSVFHPQPSGPQLEVTEILSGPEGFYRAVVPPGDFYVAARHPDYGMPAPVPLRADVDAASNIADLKLEPAHRIEGRAVDMHDEPVSLARFAYQTERFVVAEAVSDATGHFELIVPPGRGLLRIVPPARMTTVEDPRLFFDGLPSEEVDMGVVRFRELPSLHGRVTVPDDVDPGDVVIASTNLDRPIFATTDADGGFRLELETIPDTPVRFTAEHALRFLRGEFTVGVDSLDEIRVTLQPYQPDTAARDEFTQNDLQNLVGKPAPPVACDAWFNLPEGRPALDLNELRGKVVVLTLWGGFDIGGLTGDRMRRLNALYTVYRDVEDVAFVGVHDAGSEAPEVERFVRGLEIAYPVGRDADPFQTFDNYRTTYIPQTVLIDKEGRLRYYHVEGRLLELIKRLRRR